MKLYNNNLSASYFVGSAYGLTSVKTSEITTGIFWTSRGGLASEIAIKYQLGNFWLHQLHLKCDDWPMNIL